MQNIDFYDGNSAKNINKSAPFQDAEYYTRMDAVNRKEVDRNRKKASRMMSFIVGLCIISFTTGLVVGIKFTSGPQAQIVDPETRKAVSHLRDRVTNMVNAAPVTAAAKQVEAGQKVFPRSRFPFVLRMGSEFTERKSRDIAKYLSERGHTVILSKTNNAYRVYIGPYENRETAEISLKQVQKYPRGSLFAGLQIVRR
ncbi:MAG TPA: SPOR domain-containing protein [Spirochaetota bacterium]|nr:SPOR domain-containing protein [Spirochaetota bacterium]HPJ38026.1 SPOR domain-containing protein [Spirochaetota bacterium]